MSKKTEEEKQSEMRNKILGKVTKDELTKLLKKWVKSKKYYLSPSTQKEAKTHYDTLEY